MNKKPILIAPGVFDALTALLAERAGFEALYLSGASISYSSLGLPDRAYTGLENVVHALGKIRQRTSLPIICDADNGYGNEENVNFTVRILEQNGAAAIQLEDQVSPKRCGHLSGKEVVEPNEMVLKIKAAISARKNALIIARTDALAIEGVDSAIERAMLYTDAGADMIFIESPRNIEEVKRIGSEIKTLKMLNIVEGGKTPLISAAKAEGMGYNLVIYPGSAIRIISKSVYEVFAELKSQGTTEGLLDRMFNFNELQKILET
ncbi:MAG: isocitrate lyase/phosphoenolpyruvate mutase family protein [Candidatus Thermoplasmatota archaeon]|nr:isocitrate lyase/phosphoenolpyruvate mutase family protein [Candidatus Thermoplasmatota archaeon]